MQINDISVDTRHQRPSVLGKTALLMYFINDGQYTDPHSISGVSIFAAAENLYPSAIVNSDGIISTSANILMHFTNSAVETSDSGYDPSNYSAGASGIYRTAQGVYAAVLDTDAASGNLNLSGVGVILNRVSGTGDYLDVWSVLRKSGSELDSIINEFTLTEDRFFGVTEPLLFRVATRLENNHVVLGSKVDLKFTNEFTLENANIDRSIVNLFKQSLVVDPQLEIYKKNEDRNLAARVTVSSYAQTSATMDVTSENTVIFTLDTNTLATHPSLLDGTLGSQTGTYVARLKFNALNQTILSNDLAFIIR